MSEQALDALETLLETDAAPHGGMSLEMLDGYLSALVVGPFAATPEQYMPAIWGEAPPPADAEAIRTRETLVAALWDHILWRVAQALPDADDADDDDHSPDPLMPLVQFPATDGTGEPDTDALVDFPAGAEWAQGFFAGVGLAESAWDTWIEGDEDLADDVSMLSRLGLYSVEHAQDVGLDVDDVPEFEERLEMIGTIPDILAYCNALRTSSFVATPRRGDARPGRNDPCSCGSGRTYRKCCGAVTLH